MRMPKKYTARITKDSSHIYKRIQYQRHKQQQQQASGQCKNKNIKKVERENTRRRRRRQNEAEQSQQPPVHYSLLKTVCVLQQKLYLCPSLALVDFTHLLALDRPLALSLWMLASFFTFYN